MKAFFYTFDPENMKDPTPHEFFAGDAWVFGANPMNGRQRYSLIFNASREVEIASGETIRIELTPRDMASLLRFTWTSKLASHKTAKAKIEAVAEILETLEKQS